MESETFMAVAAEALYDANSDLLYNIDTGLWISAHPLIIWHSRVEFG
jgi:hypothetical protein